MNGRERCSRGNVIVSALTRFLKIGTQANVKRKVSVLVVYYSSALEGSENQELPTVGWIIGYWRWWSHFRVLCQSWKLMFLCGVYKSPQANYSVTRMYKTFGDVSSHSCCTVSCKQFPSRSKHWAVTAEPKHLMLFLYYNCSLLRILSSTYVQFTDLGYMYWNLWVTELSAVGIRHRFIVT